MITDFDNIPALPSIMGPAQQIAYMVDDIAFAYAFGQLLKLSINKVFGKVEQTRCL